MLVFRSSCRVHRPSILGGCGPGDELGRWDGRQPSGERGPPDADTRGRRAGCGAFPGRGAACHTGRKSCFYRIVEDATTLRDSGEARLFDPKLVYKS